MARLVAHDPRLPPALWEGRTGLRDLVREFRLFESRLGPKADRFVREVLEGAGPGASDRGGRRGRG